MKKLLIYSLLFIGSTVNALAQKDAQAKVILNAVSQKYHAYNIVKSDFTFTIDDKQNNAQQTQDGTLIVQAKTNKFKLTIYAEGSKTAVQQEIISDGKSQWTYIPKDKEVQLNNVDNSDSGFNPAQMFTIYEKGYKYIYTGTIMAKGKAYQVIDLTPEKSKEYFKIRLMIDKIKKQIYSAQIFDNNGSRYLYTINNVTPNVPVSENVFTYDAKSHPGIEVVDLR